MRILYLAIALFTSINCFGQTEGKLSTFLSFQANKTLSDRTKTNNSGGVGLGLQSSFNTGTWFKPTLEINADLFAGTKELYVTENGKTIESKSGMLNLYAGPTFHPTERLFLATTVGASIYNSEAHLGIRPSIGYHLSKNKRWMTKASYTNVFQKDEISNESFSYLSFALAIKLF
jgi:hypothetical protein